MRLQPAGSAPLFASTPRRVIPAHPAVWRTPGQSSQGQYTFIKVLYKENDNEALCRVVYVEVKCQVKFKAHAVDKCQLLHKFHIQRVMDLLHINYLFLNYVPFLS